MMAQTQPAQGPDRERASAARPDLAREQDVRSGLWPKPWMAKAKVPSAAVRPTLLLIRGQPRSGRIGGVAFLLVTFLWPRKEKSLAQARRAGETPSRTESSCPAWRSHANTLLQGNEVTEPLTLTLSRKGRGDGYRGRLRCANRPYVHIAPYASPVGERGLLPRTITLR